MLRICTGHRRGAGIYSWRLDLTGSYDKQRTIHNWHDAFGRRASDTDYLPGHRRGRVISFCCATRPVDDAESQLSRFQTDLVSCHKAIATGHPASRLLAIRLNCLAASITRLANAITEEGPEQRGSHLSDAGGTTSFPPPATSRRHFPISKSVLLGYQYFYHCLADRQRRSAGTDACHFYIYLAVAGRRTPLPYAPVNSEQVEVLASLQ